MSQIGVNLTNRFPSLEGSGRAAMAFLAFLMIAACLVFAVTKVHFTIVLGLLLVGFAVLAFFYWPEAGTTVVIFAIYANLPVVAYQFHGFPKIVAASVSLSLCIPLALYWFVRREKFIIDYTWLLMVGFLMALIASLMVSKNISVGLEWISTFVLEGLALYLIIINVVRRYATLKMGIWALLFAGGFLGTLTLVQELTHSYKNNFGGLAQRNVENWDGGEGNDGSLFREREKVRLANRAGGPIGGPNRYAQVMLVLIPLGLFRIFDEKRTVLKLLASLLTICILAGMLLTYSRAAFLCFCLLVAMVTFMRYIKFSHVVISLILLALVVTIASPGYLARMDTIRNVTALFTQDASVKADGATRGRVTEMLAAFNAFLDHPLVGVGPGQYTKYYSVEYMANPEIAFRHIDKSRRAHTLYFELAAETGLFGMATFMSIVIFLLYRLWRLRRFYVGRNTELANIATGFWLSIISYLTSAVFLQLAYQRYYWILLAFAGTAVIILDGLTKIESNEQQLAMVR